MKKAYLRNISDKAYVLLMKLAHLDFDIEKFDDLKFEGKEITIADLEKILINPDSLYLGIDEKKEDFIRKGITIPTQLEVIQQLKEIGLGGLKIIDMASDPAIDFKAIAVEDSSGNRAMSFYATNYKKILKSGNPNIREEFTRESEEQIEATKMFYKINKAENGKNILVGSSRAASGIANIYADNFEDIDKVFTVNGLPISPKLLNTDERIRAFSDSEKYNCFHIVGDTLSASKHIANGPHVRGINGNTKKDSGVINVILNHILDSIIFEEYLEMGITGLDCFEYVSEIEEYKDIEPEEEERKGTKISLTDKLLGVGKNILSKLKRMFSGNTKLLESENRKKENVPESVVSIRERLKVEPAGDNGKNVQEDVDRASEIVHKNVGKGTKGENEGR